MAFSYDINTSKKDKRSTFCLFSCHTIGSIVNFFLSTFLVAQFYAYVDSIYSYIINVCLFEGITYLVMGIFITPLSYLVEKTNRVWFYRLALLLRSGLIVLAVFITGDMLNMLIICAVLNGFFYAVYYASWNTLKQEMVSRKSMRTFSIFCQCAELFVKIVVPIILGTLIDVSTFSKVAICVAVICAIQIGLSFGVHSQRPANSGFSIKNYFTKLKEKPDVFKKMKTLYWGAILYGLTSIVSSLINICVLMQFGSNFSLGAMSSLFSVISMLSILIFNKFTKRGKRQAVYIVASIVTFACTLLFAIYPCIWTLIIYNIGTAITAIIYKTVYDIYRNGVLKEAGLYSEITEHQSIVEMLMESARVIEYALLILLCLFKSMVIFKIFLCVSVLSYVGMLLFLMVYERKYFNPNKENELN